MHTRTRSANSILFHSHPPPPLLFEGTTRGWQLARQSSGNLHRTGWANYKFRLARIRDTLERKLQVDRGRRPGLATGDSMLVGKRGQRTCTQATHADCRRIIHPKQLVVSSRGCTCGPSGQRGLPPLSLYTASLAHSPSFGPHLPVAIS